MFCFYFTNFSMFSNAKKILEEDNLSFFMIPVDGHYYYTGIVDIIRDNELLFVDFDPSHEFTLYNDPKINCHHIKEIPKEQLIIESETMESVDYLKTVIPLKKILYIFLTNHIDERPIVEDFIKNYCNCKIVSDEPFILYRCVRK